MLTGIVIIVVLLVMAGLIAAMTSGGFFGIKELSLTCAGREIHVHSVPEGHE